MKERGLGTEPRSRAKQEVLQRVGREANQKREASWEPRRESGRSRREEE